MKKTLLLLTVFTLILSISVFSVSAETKSLLPTDASKWKSVEAGGENATAVIKNGATVVSGSKTSWPNVSYSMSSAERITVPVKGYAIEYDIKVEKGASNMFIYMKGDTPDAAPNSKMFKFMDCIDSANKDSGSGDVKDGTYKGTITIEKLMANTTFPAESDNGDNTITFSGISIYSVSGAVVTINKFQVVEATGSTTSTASGTSSLTSSSVASSGNSNSAISSTSSAKNSSSAASSAKISSAPESSTSSSSGGIDSMWYYIIGGVAVVAIVAVVLIVTKKKK